MDLIQTMVVARWRLRRICTIETSLLDNELVRRREDMDRELTTMDGENRLAWVFQELANHQQCLALLVRYEGAHDSGSIVPWSRAITRMIVAPLLSGFNGALGAGIASIGSTVFWAGFGCLRVGWRFSRERLHYTVEKAGIYGFGLSILLQRSDRLTSRHYNQIGIDYPRSKLTTSRIAFEKAL